MENVEGAYEVAARAYDRGGDPEMARALRFRALGWIGGPEFGGVDVLREIADESSKQAVALEEYAGAEDATTDERLRWLTFAEVERGICVAVGLELARLASSDTRRAA